VALTSAPFDELLTEVLSRVKSARDEQVRWRLLLDAVVTMAAGLSLDELLNRIVEIARDLVDAKYAALGVLGGGSERRLRLFLTTGLTEEQIRRIGDLPTGHGVLGLLIDRPEPVRLHDITTHAQSFGFPPHHPPMHSFLGVPVRTGDKIFGNLYLAEKAGGSDFTAQDEEIVVALAAAAGVAIENARLHEDALRRERWLGARAEITGALMSQDDRVAALQLVADRARELADADLSWIVTGPDADHLRLQVVSGAALDRSVLEATPMRPSVAGRAVRAGTPLRVEDLSTELEVGGAASILDHSQIGPAILLPLGVTESDAEEDAVGVLALGWQHANADLSQGIDPLVASAFAEQVAVAIRMARSREDRERLAVYDDRERIGRDLHDVVIQRLFAIGLRLQGTLKSVRDPLVRERLDGAVDDIDKTIADIRRSIFELSSEATSDPLTELTGVIDRAAASLGFRPDVRLSGPIRRGVPAPIADDAVAVLAEALSNAVRHAEATSVVVSITADENLTVSVQDNGRGVPATVSESGLANMRRRAVDRGGQCAIASVEPTGTVVTWSVPLS
jgi:signal transduction histidine kinase